MINAPLLSRSSSVGSANGLVMPDCASEGPIPRTITFAAPILWPTMKPEMRTLVPVSTEARPLMLASREVVVLIHVVDFDKTYAAAVLP